MSELKWNGDHHCIGDPECLMCEVVSLKAEVAKLQAELHGTVTTKYHDTIVAEAMQRIGKLQAEKNQALEHSLSLQCQVNELERAIKGVESE